MEPNAVTQESLAAAAKKLREIADPTPHAGLVDDRLGHLLGLSPSPAVADPFAHTLAANERNR